MIRLLIIVFWILMGVAAHAQTPNSDMNRRICAVSSNKAEGDLAAVLRSAHQAQALLEITIEDLRAENEKLKKELEEAKNAK